MIHTVQDFGVINKAEVDVFLECSCFFNDSMDVGNLITLTTHTHNSVSGLNNRDLLSHGSGGWKFEIKKFGFFWGFSWLAALSVHISDVSPYILISSSYKDLTHWFRVCVCVCVLSSVWLFATPWTVALQAPLSMGFSRQEHWSGLPFPSPGESSWFRDQTRVSCFASRFFATESPGKWALLKHLVLI